ncbi:MULTISPECIES: ABC transporter ATPase [unclassified Psychrobacillus]|uniref:ABC transporter ATPase n=1 Tax=unclassified Psychrobacillus TaxID=2636677 RepID=UPI001469FAC5|nr:MULTISPECIES: ABC transporter ATPase [unclassified Psychrobacillus]MCM3356676.1 ABC transporter ATPase [Psychrobacillus sp. MER TA 171]NME04992.1 ABC transporter ATPase [Psychrobacillus sp. BL-248-WT-3]
MGRLREEDFEVLRGPLESGRQSPGSLGAILFITVFLQALVFLLEYFMVGPNTVFPYKEKIIEIHLYFTVALIILSLVFAIPIVYRKFDRIQYLVSILVSQNLLSFSLFICALFLIGEDTGGEVVSAEKLLKVTYLILSCGFLVFFATCIRFYILLKKGHYRKGSKKDQIRGQLEKNTTLLIFPAVVFGLIIVLIMQYVVRVMPEFNIDSVLIITIGIGLFFVMLFVLPEQLVILYCKYKYKSFNFNERGYLYSVGDQMLKRKRGKKLSKEIRS